MKLVECVPNFSEGRRAGVIENIRKAAESVAGVRVLDCESDRNHNRMVLTFVGTPEPVKNAALASSALAIKEIDLRTHTGEHPRMGAVDVVPFVPISEVTMDDCVALANEFASEFAERFEIPVFLYESAARRTERKDLAKVREGQFEGLRQLIGKDQSRDPDYGPKTIHPTAGATAVGARPILIAYNVNLASNDIAIAKKIAHRVRGRDGGLPTVKALGFELQDKSIVQVSMNLTDFKVTSISRAFDEVAKQAKGLGVEVLESEIVGLVPMEALVDASKDFLKLTNFAANQIIENRLFGVSGTDLNRTSVDVGASDIDFSKLTLEQFANLVASRNPTPGGGTVAAYAGVLAASLVSMVCKLTLDKKGFESVKANLEQILEETEKARIRLQLLSNEDSAAFNDVSKALALPKTTETEKALRKSRLQQALKQATIVPKDTMIECNKILRLARDIQKLGNKNAWSDAETAIDLATAAFKGAWSNVKINLDELSSDQEFVGSIKEQIRALVSEFPEIQV